MTLHEFPRLGERYWEQRLENGLLLRVVPKPGFARSYAFLGVDYGSIDTSFTRGGIPGAHGGEGGLFLLGGKRLGKAAGFQPEGQVEQMRSSRLQKKP